MTAVEITGPVVKLCPYKGEVDHGTVTLTFDVEGDAPELHDLARHLGSFAGVEVSHEQFTTDLLREYASDHCTSVLSTWTTAGLSVTVKAVR